MALSDVKVRSAKPEAKAYKLTDGEGMVLLVHPNGSKYWRLRYRFGGKEKMLALGKYPEVSLADARARRDEARKLLANGVDPSENKKAVKVEQEQEAITFEVTDIDGEDAFIRIGSIAMVRVPLDAMEPVEEDDE